MELGEIWKSWKTMQEVDCQGKFLGCDRWRSGVDERRNWKKEDLWGGILGDC